VTLTVQPGSVFAGYRIDAVIARGGMGIVYRATDLSLERPVALKLIAPEHASDERFRSRFLREPRMAAALEHPNVVPIYEAREHDGQLYLAMRFVAGEDLATRLERQGPLTAAEALSVLTPVADALDAAHRRGLVHRDVKPANILLDEDGRAYLTDFGITKERTSSSTATGQLMGTLTYVAPERIRGEEVDGRSDQYALACVLYECVAGNPPFRAPSEAQLLWAHMQSDPPPLPGHPSLAPVLEKALAKEPGDRYRSCTAFVEAARSALQPAAARPARRASPRLLLAGGVLLLAAAAGAAVLAVRGGDGAALSPAVGNGLAAVGSRSGELTALIESSRPPSNVAVGEGAVWLLDTGRSTVTQIDPRSKRIVGSFEPAEVPTDLAAGAGAVWVGTGEGPTFNVTLNLSRVDPRTREVTHTLRLPHRGDNETPPVNPGSPDIAIGGGAVWVRNPDSTISRVDPSTGRLVKVIEIGADGLAAGPEGVWLMGGSEVRRIDPATNRLGKPIRVGSPAPSAIAVGGGSVWVAAEQEGLLWKIEPGPAPVTRSIDVGVGVTYVAYGDGAVWTANYVDGMLTRVDPRTARVTARVRIGAAQSLAAGAGAAWVSTAGATARGTLPEPACGELVTRGGRPDVLLVSDLPLQGVFGTATRAMTDAIRLVLTRRDFRAGRFRVGYRSCDHSTAQTGSFENRRCAANANAYAGADRLVAVIGPYTSDCAQTQLPILNRAPGGPLALLGPTTTYPGLTRPVGLPPPDGIRGEPEVFYPTGERSFFRMLPGDDLHTAALAALGKELRLRRVFVLEDGRDFSRVLAARPFRRAAEELGLPVVGSASWDFRPRTIAAAVRRAVEARPDAVMIAADPFSGAAEAVKGLRERLGRRLVIMAGLGFGSVPDVLETTGHDAHGIYVAASDIPVLLPQTPAGRRFAREMGEAGMHLGVAEAAQATELVLDAIARSDGTRASVLEQLRRTRVQDGILGTFGFDRRGDITRTDTTIVRITGSTPPGAELPSNLDGAVIDRVVRLPPDLLG
jgi:ABC-type branched-subunit amino acid transport system substrate-binding protein/DNA-binding beta-propeller fold protein YncE